MKILIVEDQEKLAQLIKNGLKKEGYAVDFMTDGKAAQNRIQVNYDDYDLAILDLGLPNVSGLEIVKNIRERHISLPVLVLTGNNSLETKVLLFDVGA